MKGLINQVKKVAVVLTVGAVCGAVAMLAPLGATAAMVGWVIASGYGVCHAAREVGL